MDILLIHAETRVRDLLSFALEGKFQAKIQSVADLEAALPLITQKPKLIIYTYRDEKDDLFKKFLKAKQGIQSLLITNEDPSDFDNTLDKDLVSCVSQIDLMDHLCVAVELLVKEKKLSFQIAEELPESDYCRIRTDLLIDAGPLRAGVYIRLSNNHFVKIFSDGDRFEAADLEKYLLQKKIEYFWLRKTDTGFFVDNYRKLLTDHLKAETIDINTATQVTVEANETLLELSTKLGFTEEVKDLAKANMQIAVKAMKTAPGIRDMLSRFDKEKDKYIPAHSTIVAFVACALSKEMTWGSEATFQKLTMAAFLHDITLHNHQLAMVDDLKELRAVQGRYTPDEMRAYEQHPMAAADLIRTFAGAPADVDTIIMQHHETGDGKGFPRKLNASHISPLSSIFIVAHEIVRQSIISKKELPEILESIHAKYTAANFKKILKSIKLESLKST